VTTGMKRVSPSAGIDIRFTATLFAAFFLTFCSFATAGITVPKTTTREFIRVVMDDNYPPYTFRDASGTLQGILVDQWALWEKKTGIQVRLDAMDWAKAQQCMEAGDYDVIDTLFMNEQRKALYDFSAPYANIAVPLFFSRELSGIRGPKDLEGFVVGAKSGDSSIEILKASGVANFVLFDNYEAIVAAARDGKIKVFTIDKPPALYFLIKMGIQDQFRESEPLYSGEFHRAVRKGDTTLLEEVQQGFSAISKDEYEGIERHWYGAPIFTKARLTLVAVILGGSAVIVCLLLLWVWLLRRSVRRRTAELQTDITERKQVEKALRESAAQNRALIQAIPDLIFTHDRDGNYLAIHAQDPDLLILPSETLLHRSVREVLPDAIAKQFIQAIEHSLALDALQELTFALPLEGIEKHFEARISPCTADTVITLVRDVTERKMADQALRESEERFRALHNASFGGISIHDKGTILECNQGLSEMTGYSRDELIGMNGLLLVAPDWREFVMNNIITGYEKPYEALGMRKNGEIFPMHLEARNIHYKGKSVRTVEFRDITERKKAQLLLTASEEKYRTLVDNLSSGIVVHRPDTSVLFCNPIASTILGLSKEQMFGKTAMDPCWRFIEEDGSTLPHEEYPVVRMITSGEGFQSQVLGVCRPDLTEPIWLLCDGYPVKDEKGIFLQAVISFVDITERKQAEAEIIHLNEELEQRVKNRTAQLEAVNKEMEAFSYSVSHDLRAPLRGIDGFSQALVEDYQDQLDETGKKYISRIRAGTQRMGQLIDDLLLLSRVSRSEASRVNTDLSDLCRQVMEELTQGAPERRVEVTIQSGLSAWADRNLLKVALENLLRNAWKFTSKREDARIEVGELASPSGEPVFFIRDNGAGFAMEHVSKLFNAFRRLHSTNEFEGTGIGLVIVQRIIHRHDGAVWAEAEPGKGATFFFTLPDPSWA